MPEPSRPWGRRHALPATRGAPDWLVAHELLDGLGSDVSSKQTLFSDRYVNDMLILMSYI